MGMKKSRMHKIKLALFSAVMLIFLASTLWLQQGCIGGPAPLSAMVVTSTPTLAPNVVSNFEDGTLNMNAFLKNSKSGSFSNTTYAQTTMTMVVTAPVPGNGSNYALHLFGTFTDPGNNSYPAFQIQGFPRSDNSYYDVSSFIGIKFDWNCPSDDNTVQRFFSLGVARTVSGQGTCGVVAGSVPCYDYFSLALPMTSGSWTTQSTAFTALALQYNSGSPNTIQPTDLKQVLFLMWTDRSNNTAGSYTVDMWVDNVQFY